MKIVAGSNFMSWITAIYLKKANPKLEVALLNFGKVFGANSQSYKFMNKHIDFGMQTYYECGVDWADQIVREALSYSDCPFNEFEWPHHDPCITWQNGKIYNTVYPVYQSNMTIDDYIKSQTKKKISPINNDNLRDNLVDKYGELIWEDVFLPIVKKYTVGDIANLSIVSLAPLPIDRILDPGISDNELINNPELFSKLAFKDSGNIPKKNIKKRSTIYPKSGGIAEIINCLKALAENYGVQVYNNYDFKNLSVKNKILSILPFKADEIFWTLPNKHLNELIDFQSPLVEVNPFKGCHFAVFCEKGFKVSKAHYLLSYDDDPVFRITFYGNLSGDHANCYASVELLIEPEMFNEVEVTEFFKHAGLIDQDAMCTFSTPKFSPWPISFNQGYIKARAVEEENLINNIKNLVLLNANPVNGSIMQTPTLANRLKLITQNEK